jgi:hypothetical protein
MKMKYSFLVVLAILLYANQLSAQCCSGGSGSPIAGGTSQGVLVKKQLELNTNLQIIQSDNFYTGSTRDNDNKYFDQYRSLYQYFRVAYGVTPELTMSVEGGNYFYKEEVGLGGDPETTYKSSGFGDLILFPRYKVFNYCTDKTTNEITVGLGMKIPIGSYNDSTMRTEPFSGENYYVTNPQSVQLSSGAQDFIFYSFLYRGYPAKKFRVFANMLYVKKGWNPLGEKLGDFSSIGLFAGKTFFKSLGVTLQLRAEQVKKMQLNEDILLYAYPNYDPEATGYKKVFFTPQVSYSFNNLSVYALADIPVYQYLVKTQVGTQYQFSVGLSYKLITARAGKESSGDYYCPMHPEVRSMVKGSKCHKCGMDLIKDK